MPLAEEKMSAEAEDGRKVPAEGGMNAEAEGKKDFLAEGGMSAEAGSEMSREVTVVDGHHTRVTGKSAGPGKLPGLRMKSPGTGLT